DGGCSDGTPMLDPHATSPSTTVCSPMRSRVFGRAPLILALLLSRCGFGPSVNILGSFFPAWLICIVVGVVLTVITRQVFVAMKIAADLGPPGLVYPCLDGLWIFATWLVLFGS